MRDTATSTLPDEIGLALRIDALRDEAEEAREYAEQQAAPYEVNLGLRSVCLTLRRLQRLMEG